MRTAKKTVEMQACAPRFGLQGSPARRACCGIDAYFISAVLEDVQIHGGRCFWIDYKEVVGASLNGRVCSWEPWRAQRKI